MSRTPKYFKSDTCECQGAGCELCTCSECGDWLEVSDYTICNSCSERYDRENN